MYRDTVAADVDMSGERLVCMHSTAGHLEDKTMRPQQAGPGSGSARERDKRLFEVSKKHDTRGGRRREREVLGGAVGGV